MLAMSLSCIIAGTAFAAATSEQPLNPKVITDVAVQDPISSCSAKNRAQSFCRQRICRKSIVDIRRPE